MGRHSSFFLLGCRWGGRGFILFYFINSFKKDIFYKKKGQAHLLLLSLSYQLNMQNYQRFIKKTAGSNFNVFIYNFVKVERNMQNQNRDFYMVQTICAILGFYIKQKENNGNFVNNKKFKVGVLHKSIQSNRQIS